METNIYSKTLHMIFLSKLLYLYFWHNIIKLLYFFNVWDSIWHGLVNYYICIFADINKLLYFLFCAK